MERREFKAELDELPDVQDFFESRLSDIAPMKTVMAVSVAIEEIFVNIARYAYADGGCVTVGFSFDKAARTALFEFRDRGAKFDPTQKSDPDVTLPADERNIGGLGIFIVKKTMDSVEYRYENGENILTMKKII